MLQQHLGLLFKICRGQDAQWIGWRGACISGGTKGLRPMKLTVTAGCSKFYDGNLAWPTGCRKLELDLIREDGKKEFLGQCAQGSSHG